MAAKVQTRRVLATLTALASLTALGSTVAVAQTGGARAPAGSPSSPSAPSSTSPSPDKPAASPLHEAARFDHAGAVMKLLLAGADPNARDAQRNTPLHVAIREESENAFNGLLKSPATDVNAINQAGETPLMLAAIKGRLPWVKTLVERGAHVNEAGWSPLHYAASGPNEAVVRWLLEQGAALNARSPNGTTPLMMAAGYGGLSSVEVLLAANADVRLKNDVGLTAADFARRAGQDDLAKKLDERIAKGVRAAGHPVEPSQSK
ncbi:ankyrin repeat domain-containing protein [Roseateles sp. SL47]|uniref:ankyrin repeat domain-containing protein n=1 Tax=Roseateles sp. SL47 TaxID=2995138 RepID=UPI002270549E|nr:ankyrin repeat domain-containing protein [Roseateles sp. SL47]WAC70917.1 ankyrin repeat domain-containing protein [Roseateles sp. SL47]